jgi:acetoin utilization deacetylase AcuC-like enzyme
MKELVYYYPQGHEAHFQHGHPERPERVETIRRSLQNFGCWDPYPKLAPRSIPNDVLYKVHTSTYLDSLQFACSKGSSLDMDTYTTQASWELALNAAGGGIAVAREVWQGKSRTGFAITRPPGHHATPQRGMGFCLLNNIAIAAEDLISEAETGVSQAERLAIIDIDLHHGNGTQDIFWKRGDVLYISTHQWPLYPGSGRLKETGAGPGEGCTVNFPLPPFTGDEGFEIVMSDLILPLLDRFKPQMLLVSFGFDIHWLDPLGQLMVAAQGCRSLIAKLTSWADENCSGKIALFLEGGYDLDAASACAQAVVSALLELPWKDPLGKPRQSEGSGWKTIVDDAHRLWGV